MTDLTNRLMAGGALLPATLFGAAGPPLLLRGPSALMAPDNDGADAPMSREQAMEAIRGMDQPQEEPPADAGAAPAGDTEIEADPTAGDDGGQGDEPPAGEEAETDPEGEEPPAIEYPRSWDADARAVFDTLPAEARAVVLARENDRDRAVSKAQADAHQRVEAEVTKLTSELRPKFDAILEKASAAFAGQWDGITEADWARWAEEDPAKAYQLRARYDADKAQLAEVERTAEGLRQQEMEAYTKAEFAKLPEVAPELVDPKEGQARRQALAQFLLTQGVTREQLPHMSAAEMSMAYDAMRYRQLKAKPPSPKTPTTSTTPARPPLRPTAAAPRSPNNDLARAKNRLAQTGRREDAVAVIKSLG